MSVITLRQAHKKDILQIFDLLTGTITPSAAKAMNLTIQDQNDGARKQCECLGFIENIDRLISTKQP